LLGITCPIWKHELITNGTVCGLKIRTFLGSSPNASTNFINTGSLDRFVMSDYNVSYMILTYRYRIKDSTSKAKLKRFASSVNFVWNYINDLSSKYNSRINKSIYDTAPYQLKTFLIYKASRLGGIAKLINEAYTTQQCNCCGHIGGPKGENELHIREWICSKCRSANDRDVNAAKNILRIGHDTLQKESHMGGCQMPKGEYSHKIK